MESAKRLLKQMKRLAVVIFLNFYLLPFNAASASGIDARLPIYRSWAVEALFLVKPDSGHYSIRIVPWRKTPEVSLDTDGTSVHVRLAKRSLWSELRDVLRRKPSISEYELIKGLNIVETTVSIAQCPALASALDSICASYSTPLPNSWMVYADGPNYTAARTLDYFAGTKIIAQPHEHHPVVQAWLRAISVLNACGTQIVASTSAP